MTDYIQLLPNLSALRVRVADFERSLQIEFGMPLEVAVELADNTHMIDSVTKLVGDTLRVPMNLILGTSRKADEKEARHVAMYMCCHYVPDVTLVEIGEYFGKDHTSVGNARDNVETMLEIEDASFVNKVNLCVNALKARLNITENNEQDFHKAQ